MAYNTKAEEALYLGGLIIARILDDELTYGNKGPPMVSQALILSAFLSALVVSVS